MAHIKYSRDNDNIQYNIYVNRIYLVCRIQYSNINKLLKKLNHEKKSLFFKSRKQNTVLNYNNHLI